MSAGAKDAGKVADQEGGEYMFKRNYRSSARLNYNHFLMKQLAGYLLHPQIPTDRPDLSVADVGAGTGIWACELSAQLPESTRIDAFDISDAQFPAPGFRPKNVHFYTHDGFKEYPAGFQGKYDIVHARFWLCIVNDPVAKLLLDRLVSLVKPGGYLQWFEPLPRSSRVITTQQGADSSNSAKMAQSWHKPKSDSSYDWVEGLDALFQEAGLTDVERFEHRWPDWMRPLWFQSSLMGIEDMLPSSDVLNSEAGAKTLQFMEGLERENAQGVAVDTTYQCVIGRKP